MIAGSSGSNQKWALIPLANQERDQERVSVSVNYSLCLPVALSQSGTVWGRQPQRAAVASVASPTFAGAPAPRDLSKNTRHQLP